MRNGNRQNFLFPQPLRLCSYRTYEEWKLTLSLSSSQVFSVLTVPMRNGNTWFTNRNNNSGLLRSYRTYEEWKPMFRSYNGIFNAGSYRTYEEWKHFIFQGGIISGFGSYRTYEEWKLQILKLFDIVCDWFLPYLWGMETLRRPLPESPFQ